MADRETDAVSKNPSAGASTEECVSELPGHSDELKEDASSTGETTKEEDDLEEGNDCDLLMGMSTCCWM